MEIRFERHDHRHLCNSRAALAGRWGAGRAALLEQRLQELDAVDCLADLDTLPHVEVRDDGTRLHVGVDGGLDLLLRAEDGRNPSGDLAWTEVTVVTLVDIVDGPVMEDRSDR